MDESTTTRINAETQRRLLNRSLEDCLSRDARYATFFIEWLIEELSRRKLDTEVLR